MADPSNGYDGLAREFMTVRSNVGAATVRQWARRLPPQGTVLDLGCGHGIPISQALIEEGMQIYGLDASSAMISAFRVRFPNVATECNAVEESDFFGRRFDGVVAWGLMFLLAPESQALVVRKISRALLPGGQFLFTAPEIACEWRDVLTGRISTSLGADGYHSILAAEGFTVAGSQEDDGGNHYYLATKSAADLRGEDQ
jgi:2-polyprenyl-3-methyl-5-hydroxy-6-metoxy-1,4-benzoquinol methylase